MQYRALKSIHTQNCYGKRLETLGGMLYLVHIHYSYWDRALFCIHLRMPDAHFPVRLPRPDGDSSTRTPNNVHIH